MEAFLSMVMAIHPMAPELQAHIAGLLKVRELKKKEFLLKKGQTNRVLSFVNRGLLRCYYTREDIEVSNWFMKEGDFVISIQSFYAQQPSEEWIQALEDTELFYITHQELYDAYRDFPEFNIIGRMVTQRYHQQWAWQLYAIRMQTAQERYQWLMDKHPELLLRVPAKYIATYLDIAEVTLSKIKSRHL